jgi:DNA repair ATPase RecN
MNSNSPKTLWSNPERTRFFLIPDDCQLPAGDFDLRTIIGRQRSIDAASLPPFEVSREQAKIWLNAQFSQMLQGARNKILESLSKWQPHPSEAEPSPNEATETETKLAEFIRESRDVGGAKFKIAIEGIRQTLTALDKIFDSATAPGEENLQKSRTQMQELRAALQTYGISVSEKVEDVPAQLHKLYFSLSQQQDLTESAAELETLANQLEQAAATVGGRLRGMAQKLREQATK